MGSLPARTVPVELRSLAREFDLGGVTFFARNVEVPEQVAELAAECEALGQERPAWVSVDQEGGRVARLKNGFTIWPPMATLGRAASGALVERFGRALAAELTAVGVTLDYAPVLDIQTNPKNSVIGDRALSDDATRVAEYGAALVRVLQAGGVAACGKHFPGHGDTIADSHAELPLVDHPPDRLRAVEWAPFRAAIAAGVSCLMTAHVLVPSIDEDLPATLSPAVLGHLREELGFDGVVLTDDLDMRAVRDRWTAPEAAVRAIAAGCDGVLVCAGDIDVQAATVEALVKAVESGVLSHGRVTSALERIGRAKARFLTPERPPLGVRLRRWRHVVGCEAHRAVAEEMAAFA